MKYANWWTKRRLKETAEGGGRENIKIIDFSSVINRQNCTFPTWRLRSCHLSLGHDVHKIRKGGWRKWWLQWETLVITSFTTVIRICSHERDLRHTWTFGYVKLFFYSIQCFFRIWAMMALHNFLPFVALSNIYILNILCVCSVMNLRKHIAVSFPLPVFSSIYLVCEILSSPCVQYFPFVTF